ncbi:hypothetical protein HBB16_00705 [Pseudonocardia sp. MCCB 268]|nr:hypothetical protein [Pseudonocardia cytotoxica]
MGIFASTYRDTDKRRGERGRGSGLQPQRGGWEVNDPEQLGVVLPALEARSGKAVQRLPDGDTRTSMADLIVLGGCAAVSARRGRWPRD